MPSKTVCQQTPEVGLSVSSNIPLFSPEKEELYKKRFEEVYDVRNPDYIAWIKNNHPSSDMCSLYAESSKS
jgi:hypothetical protein